MSPPSDESRGNKPKRFNATHIRTRYVGERFEFEPTSFKQRLGDMFIENRIKKEEKETNR